MAPLHLSLRNAAGHFPASADAPAPVAAAPAARSWRRHGAVAAFLLGLCALLYAWTADFPLVFDDLLYLQNNPVLADARSFRYPLEFREFATLPARRGIEADLVINFILRPVAYATFRANYLLDDFRPRWFRVANIAIHAGNALLIYALLTVLLRHATGTRSLSRESIFFIATATAALFAAHPLATESVTYVAQRFTSLAAFFYLLALLLHFAAHRVERRGARWLLRGSAAGVVVLGMLTKECTVTAPLMAVLLELLLLRTPLREAVRRAAPLLVCLPIVPALVLLTAWAQSGGAFSLGKAIHITNPTFDPWQHGEFLLTQFVVLVKYLRLLVWPAGLNLDPDPALHRSLAEWPVLAALALLGALVAGAWLLHRRQRDDPRAACVFVFTLWFFATIAISSGLVPLPDLMAEHRSYLPSLGVFAAAACLLDWLRTRRGTALAGAAVGLGVIALGLATARRNEVWHTRIALWEDTVAKSPRKARIWNNLGNAYRDEGLVEKALRSFERAVECAPGEPIGYINLACMLNDTGRHAEAFASLRKGAAVAERALNFPQFHYHLAVSHLGSGRVEEGVGILERLVETAPGYRPAHMMLANVFSQTNRTARAIEHWTRAHALTPDPALLATIAQAEKSAAARAPGE